MEISISVFIAKSRKGKSCTNISFHESENCVVARIPDIVDGGTLIYHITKAEWARLLKAGTGFLLEEE